MLANSGLNILGFQRKENREDLDEVKAESELPQQLCHSRAPLLAGSCSTLTYLQTKDSVGQAGKKAAILECTDAQGNGADPMVGSSSILSDSGKMDAHPEQNLHRQVPSLPKQESKLPEPSGLTEPTAAPGFRRSTELPDFEAEVADYKIMDQEPRVSGGSSVSGVGTRIVEGLKIKPEFPSQLNGCPSLAVRMGAFEKQEGEERRESDILAVRMGEFEKQEGEKRRESDMLAVRLGEFEKLEGEERRESDMLAVRMGEFEKQEGEEREADMPIKPIVHIRKKPHRKERDEGVPTHMDEKAMSLPEEVVEKILSMMPFPDILKTRVLNKFWNTSFSGSPDALVFQNQVTAASARWKHYCPIILNIEKEWLVGYDREYNLWHNMPLKFEREGLSNWFSTQKLRGAGSLMCGVFNRTNIFVTNIVTRTWKWLPARPDMAYPKEIHLLPVGSDAYQVLLITKQEGEPTEVSCQIYDSRTESWTIRHSSVSTALYNSSSAYLDGVVYVMEFDSDDFHDVMKLVSYNVESGTWTNLHHPFGSMLHEIETYELLVCQNHIMVVLHLHPTWWTTSVSHNTLRNTLMVYKLDPVSLDIREIARGPPEPMSASCTLFASDEDCIYFGNPQVASSSVVELNLRNREWSCFPPPTCADGSFKNKWATFSFQPGLNPFVAV